jgi:hypothetical protein
MATVKRRWPFLWGSACGSSPGGAMATEKSMAFLWAALGAGDVVWSAPPHRGSRSATQISLSLAPMVK